jgi:transcriptional regulator with AAA-type ATPase domain
MKSSPESAVQTLSLPAPQAAPALLFPKRATVADLRRLRERHFREGHHELALQVATEVARRDPGRESFLRRGMLLTQVGRYREALGVLRDALRFETGPQYLVADIHLHIGYAWLMLGKRKRLGEAVKRAYALRLKPRSAFNFHMMCGNRFLLQRDFRAALLEYLQAEKTAPNAMGRGRAAINQGIIFIRQWDFAAAQGPLDRAIRILKKAGHAFELALARAGRAGVCGELGQHRRALGMLLRAGRTFRRLGNVDREAEALSNAAFYAGELGLWSRSLALLDRTIGIASVTGQQYVLTCAYANRALVCAQNEDFDLADSNLSQARRLLRGRRDWIGTLHVLRAQARIAAQVGKWNEAFRASRRAERFALKVGDALRVVEFRKMRAAAEEHLGHRKASTIARSSAGRLEVLLRNGKQSESDKLASKLGLSEMAVLLVGDGGTDKIDLARRIHRAGGRAKAPCVVVPCEQLKFPASDLFGHAEGAWSGATRSTDGYVNSAQGGTLILDCVDRMTPEDQRVLVPLLDRKTRAVGGVEERILDVRVIATCTEVENLTHELRSRLEGAVVRVPSLKDRKSEIPHRVTELIAGRRQISPDALAELARHRWEGNVVELRGVVDRLVALSDDRIGKSLVRKILTATKTRRVAGRVHDSRRSVREAVPAF